MGYQGNSIDGLIGDAFRAATEVNKFFDQIGSEKNPLGPLTEIALNGVEGWQSRVGVSTNVWRRVKQHRLAESWLEEVLIKKLLFATLLTQEAEQGATLLPMLSARFGKDIIGMIAKDIKPIATDYGQTLLQLRSHPNDVHVQQRLSDIRRRLDQASSPRLQQYYEQFINQY